MKIIQRLSRLRNSDATKIKSGSFVEKFAVSINNKINNHLEHWLSEMEKAELEQYKKSIQK